MKKVLVLMSTYNGGTHLQRQIETILNQQRVYTYIIMRDDGSNIETQTVIKAIAKQYPQRISVEFGNNEGWIKSFHDLLHSEKATGFDYYAFSDQDDVWKGDKLISCIDIMENDSSYGGPKVCQCNSITSDEKLNSLPEQERHYAAPRSRKMCIAQEYFRGCSMVWNQKLMDLAQSYTVKNGMIPHDYWVGLLGYYFGKVYYCNKLLFYHIRYSESSSGDGNIKRARLSRINAFFSRNNAYINPSQDLLEGYRSFLDSKTINFLQDLTNCKNNFVARMRIVNDKDFCRESRKSTVLLKTSILLGKY